MTSLNSPRRTVERSADAAAWLPWLSVADVRERLAELATAEPPTDADKALRQLLQSLAAQGLRRRWVPPPAPAAVLGLHAGFPNFGAVIDSVAGQLALQRSPGAAPGPLTPMLLLGSPGIGKTTFAQQLGSVLGVPHRVLPMSAMTAGFTLGGLDRGWANGRPGQLFQVLNLTGTLNPIVTLDELDKANEDSRSSPVGTLYQLLEPGTARSFIDEYVTVPMDASQVNWIATANEAESVSYALLSRFKVFHIDPPTEDQMRPIVLSQYQALRERLPSLRDALEDSVVEHLSKLEPRRTRIDLQDAAGRAALRSVRAGIDRIAVTLTDVSVCPAGPRPKAIGFLR